MYRVVSGVWLILLILGGSFVAVLAADPPKPPKEDVYELQRLLVDTLDQVERNYVREVNRRKLVEAAIKGILSELDPYSSYINPEEMTKFREMVESELEGIGVQVEVDRGQLKVISPLVGTPAYRAGIIAGDRIAEIDGKSTDGISIDEAVRRLKGKVGTQVTLTVVHPGRSARESVTVTRQAIHVETVLGEHRKADNTWDYLLDSQKRIAYVRLNAFSRDTAQELRKVLAELQKDKIRGLVLDLRFNPGGLLNSAVEVSDLFVAQGQIVSTAGRNSPERVWEAHKEGTFEGFPIAVLINRYSASASEIVAACLQDHKRAAIVGERTWGKGSVQNVIPLGDFSRGPDGDPKEGRPEQPSALKLTTAGYRRPNGKNIDRAPDAKENDEWGVTPDAGHELKLDEQEMLALIVDRRQRDIVKPREAEQLAVAGPAAPKSPPQAPPTPPQAPTTQTPTLPKASPAGKSPEPAKPAAPKAGQESPKPEGKKPETGPPPLAPSPGSAGPPSKEAVAATPAAKPAKPAAFADRQLEMALRYLSGELARAN